MPNTVKSIYMHKRELLLNEYRISDLQDEKVLEICFTVM